MLFFCWDPHDTVWPPQLQHSKPYERIAPLSSVTCRYPRPLNTQQMVVALLAVHSNACLDSQDTFWMCPKTPEVLDHTVTCFLFMQILNDKEARYNSADMNVAYRMGVDEYQRLCPYAGELEANWGKAPGQSQLPLLHLYALHCPCIQGTGCLSTLRTSSQHWWLQCLMDLVALVPIWLLRSIKPWLHAELLCTCPLCVVDWFCDVCPAWQSACRNKHVSGIARAGTDMSSALHAMFRRLPPLS